MLLNKCSFTFLSVCNNLKKDTVSGNYCLIGNVGIGILVFCNFFPSIE